MADLIKSSQDIWHGLSGLVKVRLATFLLKLKESQWVSALMGTIIGYAMVRYSQAIAALTPGDTWPTTITKGTMGSARFHRHG